MKIFFAILIYIFPFFLFADEVGNYIDFAKSKSKESFNFYQEFDEKEPSTEELKKKNIDFSKDLNSLSEKGKVLRVKDEDFKYINQKSENLQKSTVSDEIIESAMKNITKSESEHIDVSCADGECMSFEKREADSFSEVAVSLNSFTDGAEDVSQKKLSEKEFGIFVGKNITCRVVYKANRVNFCKKTHDILSASDSEKELHIAQIEGRAIKIPGNFCQKKKKVLGCLEKRESWCVFKSKLAAIVQEEGRKQKGINFGNVQGMINSANCRGISATELSEIKFDTPEMNLALQKAQNDVKKNDLSSNELSWQEKAELYIQGD